MDLELTDQSILGNGDRLTNLHPIGHSLKGRVGDDERLVLIRFHTSVYPCRK